MLIRIAVVIEKTIIRKQNTQWKIINIRTEHSHNKTKLQKQRTHISNLLLFFQILQINMLQRSILLKLQQLVILTVVLQYLCSHRFNTFFRQGHQNGSRISVCLWERERLEWKIKRNVRSAVMQYIKTKREMFTIVNSKIQAERSIKLT